MHVDPWAELARSLDGLRSAFYSSLAASRGFLPDSPAEEECKRDALAGSWGAQPVRDANIAPLAAVSVVLDHLDSLGILFKSSGGITASHTIARAVLDIAIGPWFLLEPGIGERERVRRYMNLRLESLKEQTQLETGSPATAMRQHAEDRIALILDAARLHGFDVRRERDRYKPPHLGAQVPSTTSLASKIVAPNDPVLGALFWRLGSAVAHGQQHGLTMFFERTDQPVQPAQGDAAAQMQASPKDTALRCGGAPLAAVSMLQRLYAQYGWPTDGLRTAVSGVISTWQTVAEVRAPHVPATFLAGGKASHQR
ncbi:hypothetical protein [Streptomyces spectabilis]|uniref:Uncharacterized protein n=1 Tax=Streptomyces spectabilis TaxID=68270 RepID=A0A7W8EZ81_STRST|nr:hypothetical protein [Streptomyces spectabilis]MBB5109153.1 hypothetical protein [Streptomyces spectabilis]MCI3907714.1 hypothetical protein [Streptomyces spectabilis]